MLLKTFEWIDHVNVNLTALYSSVHVLLKNKVVFCNLASKRKKCLYFKNIWVDKKATWTEKIIIITDKVTFLCCQIPIVKIGDALF